MLNIVIFGPPGAGKGTQSARLTEKYHLIHLSTGDILRGEIESGSILGQEAKLLMDQGLLVPDEIVITMINNKLVQNSNATGFIFDGFPRTIHQAEALDRLLYAKGTGISMTLALDISNEELIQRIIKRGEELGRTDDQDLDTISKRITEYTSKTAPLKEYYSKQKKFFAIRGVGSIDEIFNSLCMAVESHYNPGQKQVYSAPPLPAVLPSVLAEKQVKKVEKKVAAKAATKTTKKLTKNVVKNVIKKVAKKTTKKTVKKAAKKTAKKLPAKKVISKKKNTSKKAPKKKAAGKKKTRR